MAVNSASQNLSEMTRDDYEYLKSTLEPYQQQALDMVNSNAMVDRATDQAGNLAARGTAQNDRMASRYGAASGGAAAIASDRNALLNQSRIGTGMINDATEAQTNMKMAALGQAVGTGRRLATNAFSMVGDSAKMASGRQQAYNQALQQHSANKWGAVSGLAGLGTMAVMGGMI